MINDNVVCFTFTPAFILLPAAAILYMPYLQRGKHFGKCTLLFQNCSRIAYKNLKLGKNEPWLSLTADEARRLQDFFLLLFLTPQVGEGVDDDTKDEVEDDDDDHEEEQQVVDHSGCEQRLLRGRG